MNIFKTKSMSLRRRVQALVGEMPGHAVDDDGFDFAPAHERPELQWRSTHNWDRVMISIVDSVPYQVLLHMQNVLVLRGTNGNVIVHQLDDDGWQAVLHLHGLYSRPHWQRFVDQRGRAYAAEVDYLGNFAGRWHYINRLAQYVDESGRRYEAEVDQLEQFTGWFRYV